MRIGRLLENEKRSDMGSEKKERGDEMVKESEKMIKKIMRKRMREIKFKRV